MPDNLSISRPDNTVLARNLQDVTRVLEQTGTSLRAELRREVERLRSDLDVQVSQNEARACQMASVMGRCDDTERRMSELEQQLESSVQRALSTPADTRQDSADRVEAVERAVRELDVSVKRANLDTSLLDAMPGTVESLRAEIDLVANSSAQTQDLMRRVEALERCGISPSLGSFDDQVEMATLNAGYEELRARIEVLAQELSSGGNRNDGVTDAAVITRIQVLERTVRGEFKDTSAKHKKHDNQLASLQQSLEESTKHLASRLQSVEETNQVDTLVNSITSNFGDQLHSLHKSIDESSKSLSTRLLNVEQKAAEDKTKFSANSSAEELSRSGTEHVALAACVGRFDAELRVELTARIDALRVELQSQIVDLRKESRTEAEMRMELTTCMERLRSELQDQIADVRGRAVFNVQSLLEELQAQSARSSDGEPQALPVQSEAAPVGTGLIDHHPGEIRVTSRSPVAGSTKTVVAQRGGLDDTLSRTGNSVSTARSVCQVSKGTNRPSHVHYEYRDRVTSNNLVRTSAGNRFPTPSSVGPLSSHVQRPLEVSRKTGGDTTPTDSFLPSTAPTVAETPDESQVVISGIASEVATNSGSVSDSLRGSLETLLKQVNKTLNKTQIEEYIAAASRDTSNERSLSVVGHGNLRSDASLIDTSRRSRVGLPTRPTSWPRQPTVFSPSA
eukprot:CAMPEP_0194543782 /NCGR_PEP_ID=MMETSP0253-20130528/86396_1 /TAXON_ID=2966 /ORGANISM="Noctiluca scintillans" /LENGTH=679 /DNA_ID=CAMNT_0039390583 /DNA_START=1 /DNA_END=2040 /DNA_ORIENTATION=-